VFFKSGTAGVLKLLFGANNALEKICFTKGRLFFYKQGAPSGVFLASVRAF
jgi:hypothetical protein